MFCENTKKFEVNINKFRGKNYQSIEKEVKQFLKIKMYNNKNVMKKNNNGKKIIKKLFNTILKKPNKFIQSSDLKKVKCVILCPLSK